jgi:FkbM family methyltransferase
MKTIIECGANLGLDTKNLHLKYPDAVIYAFEPTIELFCERLYPQFARNPKIKLFPFAIDIKNGYTKFNVAGQADWGCSSIYEFSDDIMTKWPNRPDFKFTHSYLVPTITLFDFCEMQNIKEIEYLWIDTQGNDFNVLKSLGDKLSNVNSGRCEAAFEVELYKNTENKVENIKSLLQQFGFKIEINPHGHRKECDIFFEK